MQVNNSIIMSIVIWLTAVNCPAQQQSNSFPHISSIKEMGINFPEHNFPEGYIIGKKEFIPFIPTTKIDERVFTRHSVYGSISSNDRDLLVFFESPTLKFVMDSALNIALADISNTDPDYDGYWRTGRPNYMHNNQVLLLLGINQRTKNFNKDTLAHYYSRDESHKMFNADTVIRLDLNIPTFLDAPNYEYNNIKYNHLVAYVIHRHNRGYFKLFVLTNDQGQRDFGKHLSFLQQIFRYKDDEQTN